MIRCLAPVNQSDGQFKKTACNDLLKKMNPDVKFTPIQDGLKAVSREWNACPSNVAENASPLMRKGLLQLPHLLSDCGRAVIPALLLKPCSSGMASCARGTWYSTVEACMLKSSYPYRMLVDWIAIPVNQNLVSKVTKTRANVMLELECWTRFCMYERVSIDRHNA